MRGSGTVDWVTHHSPTHSPHPLTHSPTHHPLTHTHHTLGFNIGGVGVIAYVWASEYLVFDPDHRMPPRAKQSGAIMQIMWSVGGLCLPGLAYLVPYWKDFVLLLVGLDVVVGLLVFTLVPESPKWLEQSAAGHTDETLFQKMVERCKSYNARCLATHQQPSGYSRLEEEVEEQQDRGLFVTTTSGKMETPTPALAPSQSPLLSKDGSGSVDNVRIGVEVEVEVAEEEVLFIYDDMRKQPSTEVSPVASPEQETLLPGQTSGLFDLVPPTPLVPPSRWRRFMLFASQVCFLEVCCVGFEGGGGGEVGEEGGLRSTTLLTHSDRSTDSDRAAAAPLPTTVPGYDAVLVVRVVHQCLRILWVELECQSFPGQCVRGDGAVECGERSRSTTVDPGGQSVESTVRTVLRYTWRGIGIRRDGHARVRRRRPVGGVARWLDRAHTHGHQYLW